MVLCSVPDRQPGDCCHTGHHGGHHSLHQRQVRVRAAVPQSGQPSAPYTVRCMLPGSARLPCSGPQQCSAECSLPVASPQHEPIVRTCARCSRAPLQPRADWQVAAPKLGSAGSHAARAHSPSWRLQPEPRRKRLTLQSAAAGPGEGGAVPDPHQPDAAGRCDRPAGPQAPSPGQHRAPLQEPAQALQRGQGRPHPQHPAAPHQAPDHPGAAAPGGPPSCWRCRRGLR